MSKFDVRIILEALLKIWDMVQEMAWQGTIVILLVLICRFFIRKISKQACYLLWAIVAIRLVCPVMLPSQFSIFNVFEDKSITKLENDASAIIQVEYPDETDENATPEFAWQDEINQQMNKIPQQNSNENALSSEQGITEVDTHVINISFPFLLWLTGTVIMLAYGIYSYWRLKTKLRFATKIEDDIFESEQIASPFVFRVLKPIIYLPLHLNEQEKCYILAHERYHIKRRDYLVKLAAYGLLSVYWFHPLVWVSFYLMSRDMEMSCDEQVIKSLEINERKAYSTLLLSFAGNKRFQLPSPLSFGENDTKSRIRQILNYKSPTLRGIIAAFILIVIVAVGCLTDAKDDSAENASIKDSEDVTEIADKAILQLAEALYEAQNPYIGDISGNGKILRLLNEYYGISDTNGSELQTYEEPYWISIDFSKKPGNKNMWQASAMFLALVDNANEVRWTFTDESERLVTYYVTVDSVNKYLNGKYLKEYSNSINEIASLCKTLKEISEKVVWSIETDRIHYIQDSSWEYCASKVGMDFTERIQWENRMIADGIPYRGENGTIRGYRYEDFDQNGVKDLFVAIQDENWEDSIESKFCIYMNDEPVYIRDLPVSGAFWNMTAADIDNDGNFEFIISGDSGGTGGYGFNALFDILKYKNNTFEVIPLPTDEFLEWTEECHAGFGAEVYTTAEEGVYEVYSPLLNEKYVFSFTGISDEQTVTAGTLIGRERYGFSKLIPFEQNGKTYLVGVETLYRLNEEHYHGMEDIGTAYFLMNWSDTTGWLIEYFYVVPVANNAAVEEDILRA